jgi:hypothetical protein
MSLNFSEVPLIYGIICSREEKVLQIEPNTTYKKYRESAHVSLDSQPEVEMCPLWIPVIIAESKYLQLRPVQITWEN